MVKVVELPILFGIFGTYMCTLLLNKLQYHEGCLNSERAA